eukprot:TRINITY_DN13794_c0_g1_i1.p1 TRINITY_DN13794_c0_g1~~TRINITY_DN13794_c0_g1_i1.p1  ORF type:complete len:119 (-),score=21.77 TRINITY_DN13794_c0_g1_i1:252-608(-)
MVVDTSPDEHLHEVITNLFIGSQDAAANFDGLKKKNVTTIINAACGISNRFPGDFVYEDIELLDIEEQDITQHFKKSNAMIDKTLTEGGGVLVHCKAGVSRSATLILAYLMEETKVVI